MNALGAVCNRALTKPLGTWDLHDTHSKNHVVEEKTLIYEASIFAVIHLACALKPEYINQPARLSKMQIATKNQNNVFNVIVLSTGSVSFFCSSLMAISIKCSKRSTSTPYRRLIYNLSIADMILSLACIIGPFASPTAETKHAYWAVGNYESCALNGSLLLCGSILVASCLVSLCFYYLHRLKEKRDYSVSLRMWKRFQNAVRAWIVLAIVISWTTKSFNPDHTGAYCLLNESPIGCADEPDIYGECRRGKESYMIGIIFLFAPWMLSFFAILYCMVSLVQHARSKSLFSASGDVGKAELPNNEDPTNNAGGLPVLTVLSSRKEQSTKSPLQSNPMLTLNGNASDTSKNVSSKRNFSLSLVEETKLLQLYQKEVLLQAASYIGVYILVFSTPLVGIFYCKPPFIFTCVMFTLLPLGGLFHIFLYTSKFLNLKMMSNEYE